MWQMVDFLLLACNSHANSDEFETDDVMELIYDERILLSQPGLTEVEEKACLTFQIDTKSATILRSSSSKDVVDPALELRMSSIS